MVRADEEQIMAEFLEAWAEAGDDETYTRAARLVGEPARLMTDGWVALHVEKVGVPMFARRLPLAERTEIIVQASAKAAKVAPKVLLSLQQRHMRHAIDQAIFESLEQDLAERGHSAERTQTLQAIAFVDLAGFTRMTEEQGDELAVRSADLLRERPHKQPAATAARW
jgi:adenylate cyclase